MISGLVNGSLMVDEEASQPRMNAKEENHVIPLYHSSKNIGLAHEGGVISPNNGDEEDSGEI